MFWQKVSDRQIQKKQFYKRERKKWWQVNFALTVTNSGTQAHTNTHKYTQTHRKIQNEQKLRRKGGWVMQGWDYALAAVRSKGRAADYHPSYACTQYYHLCACTQHHNPSYAYTEHYHPLCLHTASLTFVRMSTFWSSVRFFYTIIFLFCWWINSTRSK